MCYLLDKVITKASRALRTSIPHSASSRPSPAAGLEEAEMNASELQHVIGLMRINHTGELCAQALYAGQARTAKLNSVREKMERTAEEEMDHLIWCEKRLYDLGNHPSILNFIFYSMSFCIGASVGFMSDKVSLGLVAATEDQVCLHLEKHISSLPKKDIKSKAVLTQMLLEEANHKQAALDSGAHIFPRSVTTLMAQISKVMTASTYWI